VRRFGPIQPGSLSKAWTRSSWREQRDRAGLALGQCEGCLCRRDTAADHDGVAPGQYVAKVKPFAEEMPHLAADCTQRLRPARPAVLLVKSNRQEHAPCRQHALVCLDLPPAAPSAAQPGGLSPQPYLIEPMLPDHVLGVALKQRVGWAPVRTGKPC